MHLSFTLYSFMTAKNFKMQNEENIIDKEIKMYYFVIEIFRLQKENNIGKGIQCAIL